MKRSTKPQSRSTNDTFGTGLKIALVCDTSLDAPDGVQQYTITLGEWLRSRGHDVHYLTSNTRRSDLPNLHVLSRNIQGSFNGNRLSSPLPASPRAVKNLLAREQFDVLHVQMPYSPVLAGQVIHFAPKTTAVIGTFHIFPESALVSHATRALGLLVALQLKRYDKIMSVSSAAQDFAARAFRVGSQVVPNMFDFKRFAIRPPKRRKTVQVVFLGRLVERKGCMHLLRALAYMQAHVNPNVAYQVRIGGKGSLRDELEAYAAREGLSEYVFFDGFVPEEDKTRYLAAADIAVFPSTGGESFGISLLEAMAATPGVVLAGDNPGYRSVLGARPKQLFDPADTDTFAHLLARYIAKPDDRAAAHTWQVSHVKQFDMHVVGQKIEALYRDALRLRQR